MRRRRGKARASSEHAHPTARAPHHHALVRAHRVASRDDAAKLIGMLRARRSTAKQLGTAQAAAGGAPGAPMPTTTATPPASTHVRALGQAGRQVLAPHSALDASAGTSPSAASTPSEGPASAGSASLPPRTAAPTGAQGSAEEAELAFYRTLMARGPPPPRPARRQGPGTATATATASAKLQPHRAPRQRRPAGESDAVADYGEETDPTGVWRPSTLYWVHALTGDRAQLPQA